MYLLRVGTSSKPLTNRKTIKKGKMVDIHQRTVRTYLILRRFLRPSKETSRDLEEAHKERHVEGGEDRTFKIGGFGGT